MTLEEIPQENRIYDGTFKRFGDKKSQWFIGHEWAHNGKIYSCCTWGDWKTGVSQKHVSWDKGEELSDLKLRQKILKKQDEQKNLIKLQTQKENIDAAEKAKNEIKTFSELNDPNHFYYKKKKLDYSVKYKPLIDKNDLIITMVDENENISGYQRITENGKYFLRGQKTKGCYHAIGEISESKIIYVAEGYATAHTVFTVTKKPCVVAFSAHNLSPVISNLFNLYPEKVFVIAADRDKSRAGEKAAFKAKKENANTSFVLPDFGTTQTALSDFNDLYVTSGAQIAREQLEKNIANSFADIEFLGFDENSYYFFSKRKDMICPISFNQIKEGRLAEIADESYWAQRYVAKIDREGNRTFNCNWTKTAEKIAKEQQLQKGYFDKSKIRGFGIWNDNNRIVLNTGKSLYVNNKPVNFGERSGFKHLYFPSKINQVDYHANIENKFKPIIDATEMIDFKTEQDRFYFLGFVFQAKIFSALNWRTHIWISAPHGTGKSTVMAFLKSLLNNSILIQDTTASGVSQRVQNDAMAVLVDEGEGDERNTRQLLDLARLCSSNAGAEKLRGTQTNTGAVSYNFNATFCFASIRLPELSGANESRFVWLSLDKKTKFDNQLNTKRQRLMDECLGLSDDLFLYAIHNIEKFKNYVTTTKEILCSEQYNFSARQADTYSNLIAGYACISNEPIEIAIVKMISKEIEQESVENSKVDDRDAFIETLMQLPITIERGEQRPLWEVVRDVFKLSAVNAIESPYRKALIRVGIYVRNKNNAHDVVFDYKSKAFNDAFLKTQFRNPKAQIKQCGDFFKTKRVKLAGKSVERPSLEIAQIPDYSQEI